MDFFFDNHSSDSSFFKDDNDRVDAKAKVTGAAKYSAEFQLPNLAHGVLVQSTIGQGYIKKIDVSTAKKAAGVIDILTHKHRPKTYGLAKAKRTKEFRLGLRIFHSNDIFYNGQPIALIVADKLEQAQYAASLIKVEYGIEPHSTDFQANMKNAKIPERERARGSKRGDMTALDGAKVKIEQEYHIATEVHSPMEPHATIAHWTSEDKLTIYDKNHAVKGAQNTIANAFKLPKDNVTVNSEFIGGGFGSGLRVWSHTFAAIMAAKMLKRPVKVVLTRPQMFAMVGYRPESWQRMTLAADETGKLQAIKHEAIGNTSVYEEFTEGISSMSKILYACPNVETIDKVLPLNHNTPIWMRAPGEATGAFGIETAMDELAHQLNIDPVQLRIINFAEKHPDKDKPWSSNFLKECYQKGQKSISWERRKATPRSNQQGDWLVGFGMATGTWSAFRAEATCYAVLKNDGTLTLQSATSDMGPGTATAMVKIASDALGLPKNKIKFDLGKSSLPDSPGQGGSWTVATVGSAVNDVCEALKVKLLAIAAEKEGSPFKDVKIEDAVFADEKIALKATPTTQFYYNELLTQKNITQLDATVTSKSGDEKDKYAFNTFAAHFVEVHVHEQLGTVRVKNIATCVDAGKIISPKTAASQISGAAVMGIGMALTEELHADHRTGRLIGADFGHYHIPTQADVPNVTVEFINEPDPYLNKMGSKGLGEVGMIGLSAAIGNAIFNATGKRLRAMPMTVDKVLA